MNDPTLFTSVNSLSHHFAKYFTDEYDEEIGKMSGRCLDIGSGPGDVVVDFVLPLLGPETSIVCSDISNDMVEFGKKKYEGNERVSFINLNIETPDLPKDLTGQFDHLTSFYCIHWCQDMRQVFENIYNLLRPGGTALITFIARFSGLDAYKKLAVMPRYQPYMKDADRYIPLYQDVEQPHKVLKALLKDIGFVVNHCSVREQTWTHDNPDVFGKFMLAVNPFITRFPADLAKEYEKDLVNEVGGQTILFVKDRRDKTEYSVLCIYHSLIVYLKKPLEQ